MCCGWVFAVGNFGSLGRRRSDRNGDMTRQGNKVSIWFLLSHQQMGTNTGRADGGNRGNKASRGSDIDMMTSSDAITELNVE